LKLEGIPPNKPPNDEGQRNPNQFRRPFNPQMFRRDRRNEEQPLRPPVKNNNENNVVDDLGGEEGTNFQEELHLIQDSQEAIHLTQCDYERSSKY
jgi:hypothetical protein